MDATLDRPSAAPRKRRGDAYVAFIAFTILLWIPIHNARWQGTSDLHLHLDVGTTVMGAMCATIALLRYYSRRTTDFLLIGAGFLGTTFLDLLHLMGSVPGMFSDALRFVSPWSWFAGRLFLAGVLLARYRALRRDEAGVDFRTSDRTVYVLVAAFSAVTVAVFALLPLPDAYYPELFFARPGDLFLAIAFGAALVGQIRLGRWRTNPVDHWITLFILSTFLSELLFAAQAKSPLSASFFGAHAFKVLGYICMLVGLLGEVYRNFRRVDTSADELKSANEALLASNQALVDRARAQFALSSTLKHLNRITNTEYASYDELYREYLEMGCEMLGLENAIISEVDGDRYTIRATVNRAGWQSGDTFDLDYTYCSAVMTAKTPITYGNVGADPVLGASKAYRDTGLESYIGAPVYKGRELNGTLCFSSTEARTVRGFQEFERDIVQIMAQTVGRMLEREQAEKDRAQVDLMKDEFLSIVSHELRTPLTSIRGALGLLAGGAIGELPEKGHRMIDIAAANTDRLVRLINDILDIERITSGKVTLDRREVEIGALIQGSVEVMKPMADEAGVTLRFRGQDVRVWADSDRLIQTMTNLLSNAIKFSPAESEVSILADRVGDDLIVQVRDQGRGVPADKIESIFERFQQVDASDSREKGGTGLGLAICKEIIEKHDGRIWVASTEGRGSTFFFSLPALKEASVQHGVDPLAALTEGFEGSVLIVEDDPGLAGVLSETVERLRLRPFLALSGAEAMQVARALDVDLIILDVVLPSGDGYEVIRWLHENQKMKDVPVIVYTALELDEPQKDALRLGHTEFHTKGKVSPDDLRQRIIAVLDLEGGG
jgi:signal transduction histidine kinase/CheY-like chemotaxis protein